MPIRGGTPKRPVRCASCHRYRSSPAAGSDRIAGGFGEVAPSRGSGPPECPVRKLVHVPPRVLFEPVVVSAFRARVAQAGPAACFVGDVVLEVALAGGPSADRAGAGRVPDLGEVPESGARVVALGLEAVVAVLGGEGMEFDEEFPAVDRQGPGAGAAGRAV